MLDASAASDGSLRQLRDMGVQLVVDDFGTGFSALEYFKRFAVQGLKIDRSFIDGLGRSREDTAIVTATLAFARALGLSVTAEGVETTDQLQRLRDLGCQQGQGFLFSRPVAAADLPALSGLTTPHISVSLAAVRPARGRGIVCSDTSRRPSHDRRSASRRSRAVRHLPPALFEDPEGFWADAVIDRLVGRAHSGLRAAQAAAVR